MLGFGLGIGLFLSPTDVNQYMSDWVNSKGDIVIIEQGVTQLLIHYIPLISLDYSPVSPLRIQSSSEFGWGPKVAALSGASAETRFFQFMRLSELVIVNLELPLNQAGTTHLFLGAGPGIHYLKFEEHEAAALGIRGQLGFGILQASTRIDGQISFDYAKAESPTPYEEPSGKERAFLLDYTSLHLDAIMHFNLVP